AAPDVLHALSLAAPTNTGPGALALPTPPTTNELVAIAHLEAPNHLQQALAEMATHLPAGTASVPSHVENLEAGLTVAFTPQFDTVKDALEHAQTGLSRFLSLPRTALPTR